MTISELITKLNTYKIGSTERSWKPYLKETEKKLAELKEKREDVEAYIRRTLRPERMAVSVIYPTKEEYS